MIVCSFTADRFPIEAHLFNGIVPVNYLCIDVTWLRAYEGTTMPYMTRNVDGISILDLEGEVDLYRSPVVRAEIGKLIANQEKTIVINFQKVTYIDSSGLATIIDAFQKMRAYNGKLALAALTKSVRSVFEVAHLDQYFEIFNDEAAALATLRGNAPRAA